MACALNAMGGNEIRNISDISILILLLLLVGCTRQKPSQQTKLPELVQPEKLGIVVSIIPQAYFVKRITDDLVDITVLVGQGQNHETYEPTPKQMEEVSTARVYFTIGLPFERVLVPKIEETYSQVEMPEMDIVDTSEDVPLRNIEAHIEEKGAKSETGEKDPHIWTSPRLVKIQAATIEKEMENIDPVHKDVYQANLASFISDLDTLDIFIKDKLKNLTNRKFLIIHPSWGYFADDYDLKQIPVELQGKEPGAKELEEFVQFARKENLRNIFLEQQASSKSAESIAEQIGGKVIRIDPLAYDYIQNLRNVADIFSEVLQ